MTIMLLVFVHLVFTFIQIIIMWFYKLDQESSTILADLEAIKHSETNL